MTLPAQSENKTSKWSFLKARDLKRRQKKGQGIANAHPWSTILFGPHAQLGVSNDSDPEKFMPSNMCKAAELQLLWVGLQALNLTEIDRLGQKRSIVLTGHPGRACSLTRCRRLLWDVLHISVDHVLAASPEFSTFLNRNSVPSKHQLPTPSPHLLHSQAPGIYQCTF